MIDSQATAELQIAALLKDEDDIIMARSAAKDLAKKLGFGLVDQARITIALTELARNVLDHAHGGRLEVKVLSGNNGEAGLGIAAIDNGPGMADVEECMRAGFAKGHGMAAGLIATKRLMDEFEIESTIGVGTRVCVRKWLRQT